MRNIAPWMPSRFACYYSLSALGWSFIMFYVDGAASTNAWCMFVISTLFPLISLSSGMVNTHKEKYNTSLINIYKEHIEKADKTVAAYDTAIIGLLKYRDDLGPALTDALDGIIEIFKGVRDHAFEERMEITFKLSDIMKEGK